MNAKTQAPADETLVPDAPMPVTTEDLNRSLQEILMTVLDLAERLEKLEAAAVPANKSQKEMTKEHAMDVLVGKYAHMKHNEAVKATGLSYGQIYSCRGEYTFREVSKKLADDGWKNPWKK